MQNAQVRLLWLLFFVFCSESKYRKPVQPIVRPWSSRSFVAPSHQETGVRQLPRNIMHVNTHGLFCWARLPDEIESWRARAKLPTTMNTFGRSIMMMMAMGTNLHNMHGMSLGADCGACSRVNMPLQFMNNNHNNNKSKIMRVHFNVVWLSPFLELYYNHFTQTNSCEFKTF